jgi:hypothetical protein
LKIKKQIKKEKARRKNIITFSIIVMVLIPYLIIVLNDQSIFKGWEAYFSFSFVALVDLLLLLNIIRILSDSFFELQVAYQRIRIKDSIIRKPLIIQADKVRYVDISERAREDFEILIVIEKGKRTKNLLNFDEDFIKTHLQYKNVYDELLNEFPDNEFYTYIIRKSGSKKYYYLYLLYKNAYHSRFAKSAVNLIKSFMEEYNLS